jgi:predicted AlkP superfamily phosphohydrolase/phosphomutase
MRTLRWLPLLVVVAFLDLGIAGEALGRFARCRAPAPHARLDSIPRMALLLFDGVDPGILREYLDRGDLPAIARLEREGGLHPLETEIPPESPVAWASLFTGVNPGRHDIFDFVVRDLEETGYQPVNGMVRARPPRFLASTIPWRGAQVERRLAYPTFLDRARDAGVPVLGCRIPLLFPVPRSPGARLLSGLGTPDLAGSNGLYAVYRTGFGLGAEETEFGGHRIRLAGPRDAEAFDTFLEGPYDRRPSRRDPDGGFRRVAVPLRFERAPGSEAVDVVLAGRRERIAAGERGGWLPVRFTIPGTFPRVSVPGRVRFEVKSVRPDLVVLASAIQIDPNEPVLPVSAPGELAREIEERYGAFKTQGWMEETFQLNDGHTSEEAFLKDLLFDMDQTAAIFLGETKRGGHLLAAVFTQTDRATHCFYRLRDTEHPAHDAALAARLGDPLREVYRRMDRIVGEVQAALRPGDVLLLASDHGFQTWRRGMNVNAFLEREGFLATSGAPPDLALDDFFGGRVSGKHVDWSKTRAYAMGLGQVYLNLRGREPQGIVDPKDADRLAAEIEARLLAYRDEATGEAPVRKVYRLHDLYRGPHAREAAEIQLGFGPGYRISWQTALLGGLGRPICEDNLYPWSGDHCSTDRDLVPGVLLANRPIPKAAADRPYGVKDVAATVLAHYGIDAKDVEGRPIPLGASSP